MLVTLAFAFIFIGIPFALIKLLMEESRAARDERLGIIDSPHQRVWTRPKRGPKQFVLGETVRVVPGPDPKWDWGFPAENMAIPRTERMKRHFAGERFEVPLDIGAIGIVAEELGRNGWVGFRDIYSGKFIYIDPRNLQKVTPPGA